MQTSDKKKSHFSLSIRIFVIPLTASKLLSLGKTQKKFGFSLVYSYLCTRKVRYRRD